MSKFSTVSGLALSVLFVFTSNFTFSQEALKSTEEEYYDFLSLTGNTKRNYLNYRTLSDSSWSVEHSDGDVWEPNNLGETHTFYGDESDLKENGSNWFTRGFDCTLRYKIYGPEWFSSYNTDSPYGVNDGALWQGVGYNTSFTGGARLEGYGFELTFKPQLSWSQNKEYDYMTSSSMQTSLYEGKASDYGYWWTRVDMVQRYGEDSFWNYDWGDSEIRWTWHTFTLGFGTQAIWMGPAFYSPMLSSNNAPTYPKFDIGFRPTSLYVPYFDWYVGDIELRFWVGKLTESDYFDNDSSNDHNQYSGFTFSYAPSLIDGLTLGVTKVTVSKWEGLFQGTFLTYAWPGWYGNTLSGNTVSDGEDMKASLFADWIFDKVGFEAYGELAFDDFTSKGFKFYEYERYPFHACSYTVGVKKTVDYFKKYGFRGVLQFEWNCSEASQDYQMWYGSAYNYGTHGQITQGYTNGGQWLGSGYGYGGNNQILSFTLYSKHGYEKFFIQRNNPDNNYIYSQCVGADDDETKALGSENFTAFKANFNIGFEELWYILPQLSLRLGFTYNKIINPKYDPGVTYHTVAGWDYRREYNWIDNFNVNATVKYQF